MSFSTCRTGVGENCFDASVSCMVNSVPDQRDFLKIIFSVIEILDIEALFKVTPLNS